MSNESIQNSTAADRFDAFRAATKGIPQYLVATALSELTPGINWRGCNKTYMSKEFSNGITYLSAVGISIEKMQEIMELARSCGSVSVFMATVREPRR